MLHLPSYLSKLEDTVALVILYAREIEPLRNFIWVLRKRFGLSCIQNV
jgi:hypothetical protein